MKKNRSRREFLGAATVGLGAVALSSRIEQGYAGNSAARLSGTVGSSTPPIAISSVNGVAAVDLAVERMRAGADTLDAVIAGVNIVELDPNDHTVGYGGLPNEQGDVELDASVMHGPTRRAGAVAAIRGVKTPSKVAKAVMDRTDHILIVGAGARAFATAEGFEDVDLLVPESRIAWLRWKETHSEKWGPSPYVPVPASPAGQKKLSRESTRPSDDLLESYVEGNQARREEVAAWADFVVRHPPTGTINCLALDSAFDISGVTTTSGMAWKIPGRVGDSPLIGCGLYVDNEVGAAGSTGRGEEVIYINGSRTIVEYMKHGMQPEQACLETLKLITARYGNDRTKLKDIDVNFYALNKRGDYAGASIWSHSVGPKNELRRTHYAVNAGTTKGLVECSYLFERRT
jgi:N4-(beta-N-acetylglucosaminyl)-L-asparaginase